MHIYVRAVAALTAFAAGLGAEVRGRWEGFVAIPDHSMRLVIDLAKDGEGHWIGSAIVPGFGVKGAQLIDISVNDATVSFAIKDTLGSPKLEGRIGPDGAFSGSYSQAGNTAPFLLKNAGPPQVDPPRRSTAIDKDLEGVWEGEITYAGKPIRIRLTLANRSDGTSTGELVAIGSKETKFPVELITQEGELLSLELAGGGIKWGGRFQKNAKELAGTFTQGIAGPVVFRPAVKPQG